MREGAEDQAGRGGEVGGASGTADRSARLAASDLATEPTADGQVAGAGSSGTTDPATHLAAGTGSAARTTRSHATASAADSDVAGTGSPGTTDLSARPTTETGGSEVASPHHPRTEDPAAPPTTATGTAPGRKAPAPTKSAAATGDPAVRLAAAIRIVLLGVPAVIQPGLSLAPLLRHQAAYQPPLVADLAYSVLTAVTALCAFWVLRRKPLPGIVALCGTLLVLVASSAATASLPPDSFFREPHWSFGLVGWHLLVLLADRPPALLVALGVHTAASVAQFLLGGSPTRTELGDAAIVLFAVTVFQLAIAGLIRLLDRRAGEAAAAAAGRERLAIRAALAAQAGRDLRAGFAEQLGATLPLLAGLADGTADPRTPDTRARCALAASQLRRLFAENDDVPDPLVHEVTAGLDVAERRGVEVALAVSGDVVDVPAKARRELTGPVLTALAAARTRARVSVLRTPELVRVAVVADGASEPAGSAAVPVTSHSRDGQTWMEARWRPE
ncbi:hypothetical protein ABZ342_33450 [Amycolatopsis sp. NPDC005961]|uniref:hypothetical protein n=1 Tax=Amycolatopsis sp. NPDC005961 TaxID=3156720 RepID=UPI003402E237